jgi:hypothetical protein
MTVSRSVLSIFAALGLAHLALLELDSTLFEVTAASAQVSVSPSDPSMPVYQPPKENVPRARIEGGTRGGTGNELTIIALVPDHVGFTTKKDPALYWHVSQPTSLPVQFTLTDPRSVRPIAEISLPHPSHAGIQTVRLKDYGISLEPGIQYRWLISIALDHDKPSKDLVTGGMIERIEFNEGSALGFPLTCNNDAVSRYAEAGLWYDAIGCISELIESNPVDSLLRRQRAFLLNQIDLPNVAEFDLGHNGKP